jgi:hydroxymethylbilane synthase
MTAALRLGTRKSPLAQAQSRWVAEKLRAAFPETAVEFVLITTSGDERSGQRLQSAGGLKTLFTKEIEDALLDRRIDLAVHSLKDMASELPAGLRLGAVPVREDPRDVWISRTKTPFSQAAKGARVGTGAVRRQAQLRRHRPDFELVPLRGNVDTRLRKLGDPQERLDGIILALAGLRRLGLSGQATEVLSADILLPAVGQGSLAIETREGDAATGRYLAALNDPASYAAATAERAFLAALGGSCQTPIAAYAEIEGDRLKITGAVIAKDGRTQLRNDREGSVGDAALLGRALAEHLLASGADRLLAGL